MRHTRFRLGFAFKEGKTPFFEEYYNEFKDEIDPVSVANDAVTDDKIYKNEKAFIESKIEEVVIEAEKA